MRHPDPTPIDADQSDFHLDTPLTPVDGSGGARFLTEVSDRWSVGAGANGGYVAGLMAKGLIAATAQSDGDFGPRHLRSLTVHFLLPATPGPATIDNTVLRAGRSATIVDGRLERDGQLLAVARGVVSADREGNDWVERTPPDFDDPRTIEPETITDSQFVRARYDTRYVVGGGGLQSQDTAEASGWIRPARGAAWDLEQLVAVTDGWVPPLLLKKGPSLMARTIDLTIHLFDPMEQPLHGFLATTNTSTASVGGYIDTETEIWAEDGRLLAQARQLSACVPWEPAS